MANYVGETLLCELTLEVMRTHVRTIASIRMEAVPGPFVPGNWRVVWIDVPIRDYDEARVVADDLQDMRHWIMVPDEHPLDGQVFGKEKAREWRRA